MEEAVPKKATIRLKTKPATPAPVVDTREEWQIDADEEAGAGAPKPRRATIKKQAPSSAAPAPQPQQAGPRRPRDALQIRAQGLHNKGDMRVFYDKKGNLDIRTKAGKYVDHVVMPTYRPITEEELLEMEQARTGRVEETEAKIEKLLPELREMITRYKAFKAATGPDAAFLEPIALSDILLLNQQLDDSYKEYTSGLYAAREI